jgi:hypothetical protein
MTQKSGQITVSDSVATQFSNIAIITVVLKAHPDNTDIVWIGNDGSASVSSATGFPLDAGDVIIINLDGNLNELFALAEVNGEKVCWVIVD